jgi:hypoxanthine phosphoribosyltransferase
MHEQDIERVLFDAETIRRRVDEVAAEILRAYDGKDLTMVAVLTGSVPFIADLIRRLPRPLRLDCIGATSYKGETKGGELTLTKSLQLDVAGRDVLIVDDILDTGNTLLKIREVIQSLNPRSVKCCVLLEKIQPHAQDIRADFYGFRIPPHFVVGYGLDFREQYRNLPYIATLKRSVIEAL